MRGCRWIGTALLFFAGIILVGCKDFETGTNPFNDGWKFIRLQEGGTDDTFCLPDYDDSVWEDVILPHSARIEPLVVNDQWQGICWYRKSFRISKNNGNKKIFLRLDGAMNVADLWVNGVHIAQHTGGFLPVVVDLTGKINLGKNIIAVRLDNHDNPLTGPKPLVQLDFNTYGGFYRDAWLIVKDKLYITDPILETKPASGGVFVTFPYVGNDRADIEVKTYVRNSYENDKKITLRTVVRKNGQSIAENTSEEMILAAGCSKEIISRVRVDNPDLWCPSSPHLYELVVELSEEGKVVDQESFKIGLRDISFHDGKLFINGKPSFLRGVNRHQEYPYLGYALSRNAQWRDAVKIKEAGFDLIRLSHYPHSPAFMDACDAIGLMVLDAVPGWQFYNPDPRFADQVEQTVRDMIRRDRNHPCVLAWEVSLNETQMPLPFIERLVAASHEEYPGGLTAGWMPYAYDIYLEARQHRLPGNGTAYSNYMVSEYGDWEYYAQNAGFNQDSWGELQEEERNSRQLREYGEKRLLQQATNIQEAHNDNYHTAAFADGYWAMFDYNRGYANDLEASGIMSMDRLPKFGYDFFRSQRNPDDTFGPMVSIASYWDEKSSLNIRVFSNCDEVELFLNGASIGKQAPDQVKTSGNLPHPPFTFNLPHFKSGTLKAIGYLGGKVVVEDIVRTAGDAASIRLSIDTSSIDACPNDLLFIYAELIDDRGTVVRNFQGEVDFSMDGNAILIGDNPATVKAGVASLLLRTGQKGGKVRISAKTTGLPVAEVTVDYR